MASVIWRTGCSHCDAVVSATDKSPSRDEPDGSTSYVVVCGACDGKATYRRPPKSPVVWKVDCVGCGHRLAVRADTPSDANADGTVRYHLRCPKCGERSEYVKPREKTDDEVRAANDELETRMKSRVFGWLAGVRRGAWAFVAAIAAFQFYRYESVLNDCKTVLQEISVSAMFLAQTGIAFVAAYALAKVIDGFTPHPAGDRVNL